MPSVTILPPPCQAPNFLDPIPGLIPFGSFCLFVGPPKIGKTSLYASWIPRLLAGKSICGFPTNPPNAVGVITTDHKWGLNQGQWFKAVGLPDIPHYSLRDDKDVNWEKMRRSPATRAELLNYSLDKLALPPGGLVIIDVATVFITNRLNDYNEVVAGIGTMSQILDRRQLTCQGVGHMSKQRSDPKDRYLRPHERVSGSGAQVGYSDTTMYLLGPEDTGNPHHTFGWMPTHAAAGTFDFWQDPATGLFVPYQKGMGSIPLNDPLLGILDAFPEPPAVLTFSQVIELIETACHVETSRAKERLTELVLDGRLAKQGRGKYARSIPS